LTELKQGKSLYYIRTDYICNANEVEFESIIFICWENNSTTIFIFIAVRKIDVECAVQILMMNGDVIFYWSLDVASDEGMKNTECRQLEKIFCLILSRFLVLIVGNNIIKETYDCKFKYHTSILLMQFRLKEHVSKKSIYNSCISCVVIGV
jgi:hypothetical protein